MPSGSTASISRRWCSAGRRRARGSLAGGSGGRRGAGGAAGPPGSPITLGGVTYQHGIGTLSINELIVDLKGQATRFLAMVGLNDNAGRQGSVTVEVWLDNRKVLIVALFNRGLQAATVNARWSDIGVMGRQPVRDLWQQRDIGTFADLFDPRAGARRRAGEGGASHRSYDVRTRNARSVFHRLGRSSPSSSAKWTAPGCVFSSRQVPSGCCLDSNQIDRFVHPRVRHVADQAEVVERTQHVVVPTGGNENCNHAGLTISPGSSVETVFFRGGTPHPGAAPRWIPQSRRLRARAPTALPGR